jgi:hypothetical protein
MATGLTPMLLTFQRQLACVYGVSQNGQFLTDNGREAIGKTGVSGYPYSTFKGQKSSATSNPLQQILFLMLLLWFVYNWISRR